MSEESTTEESTTVEVRLWSDQTNAETIEHIIEGGRGGMNKNQELHELLGKCWHNFNPATESCRKCGQKFGAFEGELNPDYAADPRLVLEAMREGDDWLVFLKIIGSNKCHVPIAYNCIPEGSWLDEAIVYGCAVVRIDLILDKTGRLRDLAIEFLRRGNDPEISRCPR